MKIREIRNNNKLTLAIKGRIDTATAPQLETAVKTKTDGVEQLEIDLKETDYISSAGLRVLLAAQKSMKKQGSMVVTNVNEVIHEIFEVTGFLDILTIQ